MPNLTATAVDAWLAEQGSASIAETGNGEEDHPEVLPVLVSFGEALDNALDRTVPGTEAFLAAPRTAAHLQPVMAHLGAARRLRLLHWLSDSEFADPRHLVEQITAARPDGSGQSVRRWLLDLQRQELLDAIFDPTRINLLLAACREPASPEQSA